MRVYEGPKMEILSPKTDFYLILGVAALGSDAELKKEDILQREEESKKEEY